MTLFVVTGIEARDWVALREYALRSRAIRSPASCRPSPGRSGRAGVFRWPLRGTCKPPSPRHPPRLLPVLWPGQSRPESPAPRGSWSVT
eukprot:845022-Prorocentrum_minimum.AAC.1